MRLSCILLAILLPLTLSGGVKVGQPAPDIVLDQLLPNQPAANARLEALKGKAVVLEFWATWCGPCIAAFPHLNKLAVQFKDRPVVFLSVTNETRAEVEPVLKKFPLEGLIGFAKDRALSEAYGVTGIPHTFLIDAAGNVAADLIPERLPPAILEDLLAKRPITLPAITPFSTTIRSEDDSLAPPVFDVMIRPSTALDFKRGTGTGRDEFLMRAGTLQRFLISAFSFPPTRMSGELLADKTRYDVWISLPGAGREAFKTVVQSVICAAFRVKAVKETRETDVLVLTAPNGKPAGLEEMPKVPMVSSRTGKGSIGVQGTLKMLASVIEMVTGKPAVDETGVDDMFDIKVKYEEGVPGSLEAALEKLGLKLAAGRRPIEFLTVTKSE
jgi:uncharacterized protein (TIGR03435 family)